MEKEKPATCSQLQYVVCAPIHNMNKLWCVPILLIAGVAGCAGVEALQYVVPTECGQVSGLKDGGSVAFKGIAYAAPPLGDLRWAAPVPARHAPRPTCGWDGVRAANEFGSACPQYGGPQPSTGEEDCLTLNIWAPLGSTSASALPVMVFLYGGDLTQGKTSWCAKVQFFNSASESSPLWGACRRIGTT
jgi:hypothetical protein